MTGKIPLLFLCSAEINPLFAAFFPLFGGVAEFASQTVDSKEYSGREIGLF
jgi:hypothetical protein